MGVVAVTQVLVLRVALVLTILVSGFLGTVPPAHGYYYDTPSQVIVEGIGLGGAGAATEEAAIVDDSAILNEASVTECEAATAGDRVAAGTSRILTSRPGRWLFGRQRADANPWVRGRGVLNRGPVRVGWGWKGSAMSGNDVFRIGLGKAGGRHIDIFDYRP